MNRILTLAFALLFTAGMTAYAQSSNSTDQRQHNATNQGTSVHEGQATSNDLSGPDGISNNNNSNANNSTNDRDHVTDNNPNTDTSQVNCGYGGSGSYSPKLPPCKNKNQDTNHGAAPVGSSAPSGTTGGSSGAGGAGPQ